VTKKPSEKPPAVLVKFDEADPTLRERLLAAFRAANLDAELVTSGEDDLAIARTLKPRAIVFATHDYAERNRELVAALPGEVRILVGLLPRDIAHAHAQLAYTGAEGWVPLAECALAAKLVAGWIVGKPPAAELAELEARVPAPAKPSAREKARQRASDDFTAKLEAIDATPLAALPPAERALSARRRIETALGRIDRIERGAKLPLALRHIWNLMRLEWASGHRRDFDGLFASSAAELDACRETLAALQMSEELAAFDTARAATSARARGAIHGRWRGKAWVAPYVTARAAEIDQAFAALARSKR